MHTSRYEELVERYGEAFVERYARRLCTHGWLIESADECSYCFEETDPVVSESWSAEQETLWQEYCCLEKGSAQ